MGKRELTDDEKFYLALGAMRLTDEQWEELWTKYPDQAEEMLIAMGKEAAENSILGGLGGNAEE